MWERLKRWARELEDDGLTLWFCCRHPGMPLLPKLFALLVVGYFLSPIVWKYWGVEVIQWLSAARGASA